MHGLFGRQFYMNFINNKRTKIQLLVKWTFEVSYILLCKCTSRKTWEKPERKASKGLEDNVDVR